MKDSRTDTVTAGTPEGKPDFFAGLRELAQFCRFPKTCSNCGRVYHSLADFLRRCHGLPDSSGLAEHELDALVVGVYRNCLCGSTLVVICEDRRDTSPAGLRRRQLFQQLLESLVAAGLDAASARRELLTVTCGGRSRLLQSLELAARLAACRALAYGQNPPCC